MIPCKYRRDGRCNLAESLSGVNGIQIQAPPHMCEACEHEPVAHGANRVTASLAYTAIFKTNPNLANSMQPVFSQLLRVITNRPKPPDLTSTGWGSDLHKFFGYFGLNPSPTCPCLRVMEEMNKRGPEWCLNNKHSLVTSVSAEATTRVVNLCFGLVKRLSWIFYILGWIAVSISFAISRAKERKRTPASSLVCRISTERVQK